MANRKDENYFDMFVTSVEYSCETAHALLDFIKNFESFTDKDHKVSEIHKIEHAADEHFHDLFSQLNKAFITPIDREDILMLAQSIDNITDSIEDVAVSLYMLDITSLRSDIIAFAELILRSCQELKVAVTEFKKFKKSKEIFDKIMVVNDIEEEGDRYYQAAVRELFSGSVSALDVIKWREVYRKLENCLDACEDVADNIEGVILKNS